LFPHWQRFVDEKLGASANPSLGFMAKSFVQRCLQEKPERIGSCTAPIRRLSAVHAAEGSDACLGKALIRAATYGISSFGEALQDPRAASLASPRIVPPASPLT